MTPKTCWYSEVCPLAPDNCGPTCVRFAEMLNLVEMSNIPEYRWVPAQLKADVDIEQFRVKNTSDFLIKYPCTSISKPSFNTFPILLL